MLNLAWLLLLIPWIPPIARLLTVKVLPKLAALLFFAIHLLVWTGQCIVDTFLLEFDHFLPTASAPTLFSSSLLHLNNYPSSTLSNTIQHRSFDGQWKLLFEDPSKLDESRHVQTPIVNISVIRDLLDKCGPIDQLRRFVRTESTRHPLYGISYYRVVEVSSQPSTSTAQDNGVTATELLRYFEAHSQSSNPGTVLVGGLPGNGDEEERYAYDNLSYAALCTSFLIQHKPQTPLDVRKFTEVSNWFCYLPVIFLSPEEVIRDAFVFGTDIDTAELERLITERGKGDTLVRLSTTMILPDGKIMGHIQVEDGPSPPPGAKPFSEWNKRTNLGSIKLF